MSDRKGPTPTWYQASAPQRTAAPPLYGRRQVDVCILGGGFTGLSCALSLAEAGLRVAVIEAEQIGAGASGRNGGQLIFGYSCEQHKLVDLLGKADARRVFQWSLEGVQLVHQRCADYAIDCHWRPGHAHVPIRPRQVDELKRWQDSLHHDYDYPLEWWSAERLQSVLASRRYRGALFDPRSGHLHPLRLLQGMTEAAIKLGVEVYECSRVTRVERAPRLRFHTIAGEIEAEFGVLAGNALVRGIAAELDARIMPVASYIAVSEPLGEGPARRLIGNDMAVADINWAVDYFRLTHDHRLFFGGRASYSTLPPPSLRGTMQARVRKVFPQLQDLRFDHVWGGLIDISLNRAPHWGRLQPNLYFAQGFSGHGLNTANLAGKVIAEAIRGQADRLDVFERIRHLPFPGGRLLRTPLLVAAMSWYKLRDALW
ncbi:NAD(P)/FAD-dependent oxidoreductase [Pseudomarimonas arenosa]|uniref:FAD-binding oxidoreductase n=1 Tax=Pseudomarimonas arenosa TaxID=2774145 RepID=A0AAW3ZNN2_9GAMM|nr:FAD-binding oxidoreductase [Pseudomarimonas arenosa]MBD8527778.1 FAD-binding oxidoreductase [Pseudomarimonas arenosa]